MDNTGQQLHPNWRALATLHIPLKRFIREGTEQIHQGTHRAEDQRRYEIQAVDGKQVREFYEELVETEESERKPKQARAVTINSIKEEGIVEKKIPFDRKKFHCCAMQNNVKELQLMSINEQDVDVRDAFGWTALMMASCEGALEAVKLLLQLGADRAAKDSQGRTALDMAIKKNHWHIVEILKSGIPEAIQHTSPSHVAEEVIEPFYCDICQKTFTETSQRRHQTSTVHQFNSKSQSSDNKLQKFNIPPRNRGLQLMVKQGWDKESGLGPSHSGRLYPIKTVIRKQRSGLGIDQDPARVTHFQAFDHAAVKRHNSDFYKKKPRNRNDIKREKVREWKRDRRLRNELN